MVPWTQIILTAYTFYILIHETVCNKILLSFIRSVIHRLRISYVRNRFHHVPPCPPPQAKELSSFVHNLTEKFSLTIHKASSLVRTFLAINEELKSLLSIWIKIKWLHSQSEADLLVRCFLIPDWEVYRKEAFLITQTTNREIRTLLPTTTEIKYVIYIWWRP